MAVYEDHLEFGGIGLHRWELRKYTVPRERVEAILRRSASSKPWFLPVPIASQYGIEVICKPAGAFGDRDEYRMDFDAPAVEEVVGSLRAAGYPVPSLDGQ